MTILQRTRLGAALLALAIPAMAGTYTANFTSTEPPAGSVVQGTADGGVERTDLIEAGVLKITQAANGQSGSIIIDDLDAGAAVYGFDFRAKVRVGGGTATPADGFSINFDPSISDGMMPGEEGTGGGITLSFDLYVNVTENVPAPSIDVKVGGTTVATRQMSIPQMLTGDAFADLHFRVGPDGGTSVGYNGMTIFTNLYFPGYSAITGGRFAIGGRTGGLNVNQWFDDLQITTYTTPSVGIGQEPASQTVVIGSTATFTVAVNNPDGATIQWLRDGQTIPGATEATLTVPNVTAGDNNARFSARVTGPGNTVVSQEALLTTVDIQTPAAPELVFDFTNGELPANTALFGTEFGGYLSASGGVNDSGSLHITDALNDQRGTFIVEDPAAGAPVYGFTAAFDALLSNGSALPADGFSFSFGNDIPDDPTTELEQGLGSGLRIVFDIYDNGGGEAPAIEAVYNGKLVAQQKVPFSFIETSATYVPVIIRLESDGTLDVTYKDVVIFNNIVVPGFTSISGGRFALAGRTGGQNIDMWFDNVELTTVKTPGDLRIVSAPTTQLVAAGSAATFSVVPNDPAGVTYQWLVGGVPISNATESSYTIPATALNQNGGQYSVRLTRGGASVTSAPVTLTVVDVTNPTATFDFESGTPAGTTLYRAPVDTASAGYIEGGVLHLTDAVNGVAGGFVVAPLLGGAEVSGWTAAFDLRLGGGSGNSADAFNINFAPDLPTGTVGVGGAGTGVTVEFDLYDNGGGEAPAIDVEYKNVVVASTKLTKAEIETGDGFKEVVVRVSPEGLLDLSYGGRLLYSGLQLTNYTPTVNGQFGFYALTGGENENQWVDNIRLKLTKTVAPLAIAQQPGDALLIAGSAATFSVTLNDPQGATFRWFKNDVEISGATGASYTTPNLTVADSGSRYSVTATSPAGTVTSRTAIATVVPALTVSNPTVSFDFQDDQTPAGATINGTVPADGEAAASGYVSGGVVHLTDAVNGQTGSFVISDVNGGEPVNAINVHYSMLIGGTTGTPADGVAFVWGSDVGETALFREGGIGNGLIVSFDTYVNTDAGETTPTIDVFYKGQLVATRAFPNTVIRTGDVFEDVFIRVESDGTLDLQYRDLAIYSNLRLPGFEPVVDGRFGFGAGTGGANDNHWIDNIQIATSFGAAAPEITSITQNNGQITIEWTGGAGAVLQSTDRLDGTWTDVTGATSPYTTTNTDRMRFFRVRQ